MAVSETARNSGIGGRILETCIDYVKTKSALCFWCYARVSAIKFYHRYQFRIAGEEFDFPDVGPVVPMIKTIFPKNGLGTKG